jgi:hypothetical protein
MMLDWGFDLNAEEKDCGECQGESCCHEQVAGDHYQKMKIQPWDFILTNDLRWCEANAVKYICRHRDKGGADDIKKAISYLKKLLKYQYSIDAE